MANIIKIAQSKLAALPADMLVRQIDRSVRRAFRDVDDANAKLYEARLASEEYAGDDPAEAGRLKDDVEKARIIVRNCIKDIEDYIAEQMELFKSKNLDPNRAYKEAIVPTGQILPNGVEVFKIVTRGASLEPVEDADECHCSVSASTSYSSRLGTQREQRRGKYNDGHLLIEQSSISIDRSEVTPFACACR